MRQSKTVSLIGLAMKAGKAAGGEYAAETTIRQGKASLVILSEDASDNTVRKFSGMAASHKVPAVRYLSKTGLGQCIGKGERSCLVITEEALAEKIAQQIQAEQKELKQTGKVVENIGKHQNS